MPSGSSSGGSGSSLKRELAAKALRQILESLPPGEVTHEWLSAAVSRALHDAARGQTSLSQDHSLADRSLDSHLSRSRSAISLSSPDLLSPDPLRGERPRPDAARLDHSPNATELDVLSLLDPTSDENDDGSSQLDALPHIVAERYLEPELLGVGGQGIVHQVVDRHLNRQVALKALRIELASNGPSRSSFLREARIVAQLNHAGIVPIFDVGMLPEGAPCYTMRRILGRSLRELLVELRDLYKVHRSEHSHRLLREFNRRRLIEMLVSAAHTMGYAHDRGVIHCDLKPANLMTGDYGEVLVVDWGIAQVLGHASPEAAEGPVLLKEEDIEPARAKVVRGTPGYMAPEQTTGVLELLTPATDVFALGMILYEMLVGVPARPPGAAEEVLRLAREGLLEAPESRRRQEGGLTPVIPEELEQICMRCLAKAPEARFPNGEALANALQFFLDGEQRREIAEGRAKEAESLLNRLTDLHRDLNREREEARLLAEAVEPWLDIEHKRRVWDKEDRVKSTEARIDLVLNDAFALYTQALGEDPENSRARAGLARLNYDLLVEAEYWGRVRDARRYEGQVRRLDDGLYRDALQGDGFCTLESDPPGAEVTLYSVVERDRQWQQVDPRPVGRTPVELRLPMGRYLAVLKDTQAPELPGNESASGESLARAVLGREVLGQEPQAPRAVHCPLYLRRSGKLHCQVRLYPHLLEGFVAVPAGAFIFGGDRLAPGAAAREEKVLEDFAMAVFPVTCGEYLEFLRALARVDVEEALRRAPRRAGQSLSEPLWPFQPESGFRIPRVDILGNRWSKDFPVRCLSREDGEVYARWRSARVGIPLRLPTEAEWEKAGRGVDGRWFPWGNQFDASFCKMKDSRPGAPELEPVGTFPQDCSPYGVRDLAGGVIEWVAGPFDRHGVLGIQKGGFWMASQASCRIARRFGAFPATPEPFAGFRLAYSPNW